MNNKLKELTINLQENINWENWENNNGEYYKLGDVIFSKLEWVKTSGYLNPEDPDKEEYYDILVDIQNTVCPILNELDTELNGEIQPYEL